MTTILFTTSMTTPVTNYWTGHHIIRYDSGIIREFLNGVSTMTYPNGQKHIYYQYPSKKSITIYTNGTIVTDDADLVTYKHVDNTVTFARNVNDKMIHTNTNGEVIPDVQVY